MNKYLVLLLFTLFNSAYALPADLLFDGEPIDSLCFFGIETSTQTIDLHNCGAKNQKYIIKGKNSIFSKKDFIGYDWQDPNFTPAPQGYSYYKVFAGKNNKFWIYTINNGGGSGEFTEIYQVQRVDKHTLTLKTIMAGDRCNNGIQDVTEKNHSLTFSVNLTAYDLIDLADKKISTLKVYDDLAACAVCCVAKAFYTISDNGPKLTHVTPGQATNMTEMPDQGKYSACFNKLFIADMNKYKINFNQEKINDFAEKFKQTCIK